ncbi:hypothetical protein [Streptomyces sp. NPDC053542]|uniref:hypothetical protein n=1 Tax=Streptomyces sp. NPDC053542 TaxID=3365710 RepID=UPI0037CD9699
MKLVTQILSGCLVAMAVPVLTVLGLFTLDSCQASDATLDSAQIVGTWRGEGGARVEFHKEGTFEMTSVPRSAVDDGAMDLPPGKGKLSGRGTWDMRDGDRRTGSIALHFDAAESFSAGTEVALLEVQQAGDSPQMYFDVNPDKHYGYEIRRVRG